MTPRPVGPPWLIEHAPTRTRLPLAAWTTAALATLPWVFWSRVSGRHRVRLGRLLLWPVLVLVPLQLLCGLAYLALGLWEVHRNPWMPSNWGSPPIPLYWSGFAQPFFSFISGCGLWPVRFSHRDWAWFVYLAWALTLALPLAVLAARPVIPAIRMSRAGVARAAMYSLWWLIPLMLIRLADLLISLGYMTRNLPMPPSSDCTFYDWRWYIAHYLVRQHPAVWGVGITLWLAAWWWGAIASARADRRGT